MTSTNQLARIDPRMDLHDHIRELTRPHTHRQHFTTRHHGTWYGQHHTIHAPALLTQLQHAPPLLGAQTHGGYESRPAASLDSIDTLIRIDTHAAAWVRDLGHDDPGHTDACVQLLGALTASQPPATRTQIAHDVRAWWTWARIATGWDSPAWRPDNNCPLCGRRGSLRVKLDAGAASCTECGETWNEASIGLLADHIRAENLDLTTMTTTRWRAGA